MKFRENPDGASKRMLALIEEMNGGSDRAAAIVGAAWVEEALSDSIAAVLLEHNEARKRLFGGNGFVSNFSSKIDLSRLLGIVSDNIWSDLHRIRGIRNEFAHRVAHEADNTRLAFCTAHIADKCLALHCVSYERHTDPRAAYIRACATLNADLDVFTMVASKVSDAHKVTDRMAH